MSCPSPEFYTKFREEGETAPKSGEEGVFTLLYLPLHLSRFFKSVRVCMKVYEKRITFPMRINIVLLWQEPKITQLSLFFPIIVTLLIQDLYHRAPCQYFPG